jgi:8-amino-7-oxononanoate synthase
MTTLEDFAAGKLRCLEKGNIRRSLTVTDRGEGIYIYRGGRRLTSFSCNDYLNLSHHPAVKAAAIAATDRYGAGAAASRLVTGNHPLFESLENALARHKQTQAALIFSSGYQANIGIIPALMNEGDLILLDELSHACILAGAKLSGAQTQRFRHNDIDHLQALLAESRGASRNCLIVTETVFSMDGDLAPLAEICALAKAYEAWTMTDDAHGFGIVEPAARADLQMGTLSKTLGSMGGYLCASRPVIDLLVSRARSFVYSTGLAPAGVAAAGAALAVIEADPALGQRALEKSRLFAEVMGLPAPQSAIVPVIIGDAAAALAVSRRLEAEGYLAVAIRPPTVPEGTARLRFTLTPAHMDSDIRGAAGLLKRLLP